MIEGLKPYPEYKESGLPWLDTVPKHWDMAPNRALMRDQRQVVGANASKYTLLSLTLRGVIARDMVNPKGKFPAQFNTYKVVKPDDFVFCLFDIDETPRGVGLSPLKGMITGAYDIFSPTHRINPRFLYHYYLFVDEGKLMKPLYTGLRKTIQRGVFASLKAPLPPPDEQAAIVRFLDHANRKIDGFIRAKRKLIGLLNEQKQAIIHRAVTRGLNPNARLKPSGIPWLGDIPQHWELTKLKHLSPQITVGIVIQPAQLYVPSGVPCLRSLNISSGRITTEELVFITDKSNRANAKSQLRKNDVVVVRTGRAGIAVIVPEAFDGANCVDLLIVRESRLLLSEYLVLFLGSQGAKVDIAFNSVGAIQAHYNTGTLANLRIPLPTIKDQETILDSVTDETAPLNTAIARTEREIALMREYRTRLTADVVTGKLDVREAAAKLPEITLSMPDAVVPYSLEETELEQPDT